MEAWNAFDGIEVGDFLSQLSSSDAAENLGSTRPVWCLLTATVFFSGCFALSCSCLTFVRRCMELQALGGLPKALGNLKNKEHRSASVVQAAQ